MAFQDSEILEEFLTETLRGERDSFSEFDVDGTRMQIIPSAAEESARQAEVRAEPQHKKYMRDYMREWRKANPGRRGRPSKNDPAKRKAARATEEAKAKRRAYMAKYRAENPGFDSKRNRNRNRKPAPALKAGDASKFDVIFHVDPGV